jgi:thiol peroxidase
MTHSSDSARTTTLKGNPFRLDGPELKPGDKAPDFEAVDASLQTINLEKTGRGVRIFSVVPSLDTPVCDAQTRRFDEEAAKLSDVRIFSISMDLPFAQKRWCGNFGINKVSMISDHRTGSFGEHYGTLIPDLRIESRAIFVVDSDNTLRHVEYVKEVGDHPDYQTALRAAKQALEATAAKA